MTHKERILATLNLEPVDLLPYCESLWGETRKRYIDEGHLEDGEDAVVHFDMSCRSAAWLNSCADLEWENQVLEETEETILIKNGNHASLRNWKNKSGTPEHVDFDVKERDAWEALIKPHLVTLNRDRINFESYRNTRKLAAEEQRAFHWSGVGPFELMHPVCGHEYMLMGMALDPDWVKDMVNTYVNWTIQHVDLLFSEEGTPDFFWIFEDMGFKQKPFMSPDMYREIIQPGHQRLFDFAHQHGLKVLVHSCGFVEPLVPGLVEAGMDCLQAMEVKAGMHMPRIAETFGDKIAFCGNIDIRIMARNDLAGLREELDSKVKPLLRNGGGFIVHSDHSIPPDVDYDTLCTFFDYGSKLVQNL